MMLSQFILIKSFNSKYFSISQNGKLTCDRKDKKEAEILTMKYEGKYITLQIKPGKYLSASMNGIIDIDKEKVGNNERFEIEWLDEDWFTLKTSYGYYISLQKDGKIEGNQKNIGNNEKFSLIVQKVESLFEFLNF